MQQTIHINGEKVQIKTRIKTRAGNIAGYNVFINGKKYFVNTFIRQDAIDIAFVRFSKGV